MEAAPKVLVILGAPITLTLAVDVLPVPPLVDVTCTELFFAPAVVPVTFTEKVQLAAPASVAVARLTLEAPAVAVMVPPPQVPVSAFGVATTRPAGNVSVKATPVRPVDPFGFVTVKLRLVLPPSAREAAPKVLVMLGGEITVTLAVDVLPVPPLVDVTVTELFFTPAVVPVTFTEKVQEAAPASVAVARLTLEAPAVAVMVPPPQVPVSAFGLETTSPAGKVSVKATPVRLPVAFGFVTVKLRLVLPPTAREAAPKLLVMLGAPVTLTLAFDVLPVPPLVDVTVTELFFTPAVVPVTFTEKVQLAAPASVAVARLTLEAPAVAVMVPPPQLPVSAFGVETTSPAGKVSVKATPARLPVAFGFVTVKLRLVLPPTAREAAPKVLVILGGPVTLTVAFDVLPVPPLADVTCTELFFTPAVVPVTFTEKIQLAPPATVAPARLTLDAPAVAVMVPPPQLPVSAFGVETTRPAGNVSVKATPVRPVDAFGFVTVKLRLVLPPTAMEAVPKVLVILGGPVTLTLAFDVLPVPPLVDVTVTELFFTPAVVPVTFTENVQLAAPASAAAARLTLEAPAVAVMEPAPQVPVSAFGVATTRPAGNVSVKAIPVRLVDAFGFVTVKLRLVLPPTAMEAAPKVLVILGGDTGGGPWFGPNEPAAAVLEPGQNCASLSCTSVAEVLDCVAESV